MNSDLTFITNEENQSLLKRFQSLIKDTKFFDVLVGYFYTSGFYALYKQLEKTEKVRVLIGIGTNKQMVDLIQQGRIMEQGTLSLSHAEAKEINSNEIEQEMENSEDNQNVEEGVNKFLEWLRSGKLEFRGSPSQKIHAKVYIMTFKEGDRDTGRVITGSSNFTQAGLVDNLEFNVELKNRSDYDFAHNEFEKLWEDSVDLKDTYFNAILRTWINDKITPFELYLKFLYEYFKEELNREEEDSLKYKPSDYMELEYQNQAVLNAKRILDEYGGLFLSDVVGLGKTYISAKLAKQLDGRNLVIAPPILKNYWSNVFNDFYIPVYCHSLGKLDDLINMGTEKYKNIFIDEAHRFRTESNITYEKLAQICRGKRVILVTATPYNNSPRDILSQIKLFQKTRKSTIPGLPDLETFFNEKEKKLKTLDRQINQKEYINLSKEISKEIREKVLKYLMIRRTRSEIVRYFEEDLKKGELKFPEVEKPKPVFYQLNDDEDKIFNDTIELITQKFKYARYVPMLYYDKKIEQPEKLSQINMLKFMKILLVKRLESSFFAFRNSIDRFIRSYERFLKEYENGKVWVSKKYTNKLFEILEKEEDDEAIQRLIDEDKARCYPASDFIKNLEFDLKEDLETLKTIKALWNRINRDPKLLKFIEILSSHKILKENKIIVFTESKETADYLADELRNKVTEKVISFTGQSSEQVQRKVIDNFDANAKHCRDDYRIVIATEVLSEGVNLHRSNVVINYDIPWNPTRLMQRVGRINRVDSKFEKIFTFNFFPTKQSNDQIKLEEAAKAKIQSFITLLGNDANILTEGESIESHELFSRLTSKNAITGEDEEGESDLKYLKVIKDVRDNNLDLFARIKHLPKKARTCREDQKLSNTLLTYFRKGKLQKFFLAGNGEPNELDFISAAKHLEVEVNTQRKKIGKDFYELLKENKEAFKYATTEELEEIKKRKGGRGRDSATRVSHILRAVLNDPRQLTEEQEEYIKKLIKITDEGGLPKHTTKTALKELHKELKNSYNPLRIIAVLKKNIPDVFLKGHISESAAQTEGPREVILSEYFTGE